MGNEKKYQVTLFEKQVSIPFIMFTTFFSVNHKKKKKKLTRGYELFPPKTVEYCAIYLQIFEMLWMFFSVAFISFTCLKHCGCTTSGETDFT